MGRRQRSVRPGQNWYDQPARGKNTPLSLEEAVALYRHKETVDNPNIFYITDETPEEPRARILLLQEPLQPTAEEDKMLKNHLERAAAFNAQRYGINEISETAEGSGFFGRIKDHAAKTLGTIVSGAYSLVPATIQKTALATALTVPLLFASGIPQVIASDTNHNPNQAQQSQQAQSSFTYQLKEGLNLLSLPVTLDDTSVKSIIAPIRDDVRSVFALNDEVGWAANNNNSWLGYLPGAPDVVNDLQSLEPGTGFYIRIKEQTTQEPIILTVTGTPYETFQPKDLNADQWYLLGAPAQEITLADIIGNCESHLPARLNSNIILTPGEGLWFKSIKDCTLELSSDPLLVLIDSNPDLNMGLNERTRQSMLKEFKDSPYAETLRARVNELSEAWNHKVRREDEVLCVIVPQYTPNFDCNSEEAWTFRYDNGSYHLQLWLDGNSILPLDNSSMVEWAPNRTDRELVYMEGLWVPNSMTTLDLTRYKIGTPNFQTLRNNMDLILGVQKINGLSFDDLRDRIVSVVNDSDLISYPQFSGRTDSFFGEVYWGRQTLDTLPGFTHTLPAYGSDFVPVLEANWDDFKLIKMAYGLGLIDIGAGEGDKAEQWDSAITKIYTKALGGAAFNMDAHYPEYTSVNGEHQTLGIAVPAFILGLLPQDKLVFKGQIISPYSALSGVRQDQIPYIKGPNSAEIVWER